MEKDLSVPGKLAFRAFRAAVKAGYGIESGIYS
mgnify:CR=1 FL=1